MVRGLLLVGIGIAIGTAVAVILSARRQSAEDSTPSRVTSPVPPVPPVPPFVAPDQARALDG
jgi:hypothetical protein